jgi:hypothetical protein
MHDGLEQKTLEGNEKRRQYATESEPRFARELVAHVVAFLLGRRRKAKRAKEILKNRFRHETWYRHSLEGSVSKAKKIGAVVGAIVVLLGFAAAFMIGPQNLWGMLRYDQRQEGRFRVGDAAPDADLLSVDGVRREKLSAHIGDKPLVLIFGSFT